MKVKGIILVVLLVCAIGLSVILYSFYTQVNVTEQEACAIGEAIIAASNLRDTVPVTVEDAGSVWHVESVFKWKGNYSFSEMNFVEISKQTGRVVKIGWRYIDDEEDGQ